MWGGVAVGETVVAMGVGETVGAAGAVLVEAEVGLASSAATDEWVASKEPEVGLASQ